MVKISVALLCCRYGLLFMKMRAVYLRKILSYLDDGKKKISRLVRASQSSKDLYRI